MWELFNPKQSKVIQNFKNYVRGFLFKCYKMESLKETFCKMLQKSAFKEDLTLHSMYIFQFVILNLTPMLNKDIQNYNTRYGSEQNRLVKSINLSSYAGILLI